MVMSEHAAFCFEPGICAFCREATDLIRHAVPWDDGPIFGGYDADCHWFVCTECGETEYREHVWITDESEGDFCAECGVKYDEAMATPIPTAEPTAAPTPTAEHTAAPTGAPAAPQKPAASGGTTNVTAAPALDDDGFLSRFRGNSGAAADGDLLSGNADVTLTMEASGEADYDGSVLTVFRTGSREDGVIICLSSQYAAAALANFTVWRAELESIEELRGTESFKSFVELAEALVESLLPEKMADEVDALIVKLLQSGLQGALENIDVDFGDDIDGEIVGYLAEDGYEFFLVTRDDGIELLVREAA